MTSHLPRKSTDNLQSCECKVFTLLSYNRKKMADIQRAVNNFNFLESKGWYGVIFTVNKTQMICSTKHNDTTDFIFLFFKQIKLYGRSAQCLKLCFLFDCEYSSDFIPYWRKICSLSRYPLGSSWNNKPILCVRLCFCSTSHFPSVCQADFNVFLLWTLASFFFFFCLQLCHFHLKINLC